MAKELGSLMEAARIQSEINRLFDNLLDLDGGEKGGAWLPNADLLESHHEAKVDAPSGTALSIARAMIEGRGSRFEQNVAELQTLADTRGGDYQGINVHSARMQGRVARHEVVFGALGQTLTLIHDSINRDSFMPGVMLAIKRVIDENELIVGLGSVLGFDKP